MQIKSKLIIFLFLFHLQTNAQGSIKFYTDLGQTNVSDGFFVKSAALADYKMNGFSVGAGFQSTIAGTYPNAISGLRLEAFKEINIKKRPIAFGAFYMWTPFSTFLEETNWGIMMRLQREHFSMKLGTSFRTYTYTQAAQMQYGFIENNEIHENWNTVYAFSYDLNKPSAPWNVGVTLTNMDCFLINQETNPFMNIHGLYQASEAVSIFAEAYYKTAGAFNLHVNYFGFLFKTGLIWKLK